jgi:hypothetical protein
MQTQPGDLIHLKQSYMGKQHPDDHIVGIVVFCYANSVGIMFTERNGNPVMETCTQTDSLTFYERKKP